MWFVVIRQNAANDFTEKVATPRFRSNKKSFVKTEVPCIGTALH